MQIFDEHHWVYLWPLLFLIFFFRNRMNRKWNPIFVLVICFWFWTRCVTSQIQLLMQMFKFVHKPGFCPGTSFCRTSLPLASNRCVQSTFSRHCPLSSNRATGSGIKFAYNCALLPPWRIFVKYTYHGKYKTPNWFSVNVYLCNFEVENSKVEFYVYCTVNAWHRICFDVCVLWDMLHRKFDGRIRCVYISFNMNWIYLMSKC